MHQGMKKKCKLPLLVKEIILPHGQDGSGSSKNSCCKNEKEIMERSQEIICHRYKKEQHEPEVSSLMVLEKKPLENYFEGTRKGKEDSKRKTKLHRTVIPPTELLSTGAQTLSEEEWKQTEEALAKEEKTEIQLLSLKIYEYEKTREEADRRNHVRQKRAEEDYNCQLETLVKKWFKTGKRRQATKKVDDDLAVPKFLDKSSEGTSNRRTMKKISTTRQHCSEDPVPPPGKPKKVFKKKCQPVQVQPTASVLVEDFYEKLVFFDDDSDEFDYADQNLEFRNSSR